MAINYKLMFIIILFNKLILKILYILWSLGFINGFLIFGILKKNILIYLKYIKNQNILKSIYSISKPGNRVYITYKQLLKLPIGIYSILSTNYGIFNHYFCIQIHIGGECLLIIY